ncbi:GNAT family N-acetyltransferase [Rufibacter sediminis]|uniref:GNAT family N-acetyltransferase n=1 Tax=Rufibacter sediminis TaxID=2762756 RepID=A0ABR6VU15_9BACT|nr:GNAT family N-acetyltransferase [Rufibacter sediminis]MBC3540405.1 GNAT family N-acetyltransferase [Rufibacter sediminis]
MIHLLRRDALNETRWKTCLQKAHQPLVYVQFWYLEAVCAGQWAALVEMQGEEYVSLFPVPVRRRLGQASVYQPLFTQQLGLVLTPTSQHRTVEEYLNVLTAAYPRGQYQMPLASINPSALPETWFWRLRPNYELSLTPDYAALRQNYSSNLRRNLQKAHKEPFTLQPTASITALIELFRSTKGQELPELRSRHYQRLVALHDRARQEKAGQVWEVRSGNNLLAAAFMLTTPDRITFLFGASSARGRQQNAMAYLLDQLIQRAAGSGKTFDFEGSEVPGVANFYAGFGAQPVSYVSLSLQSNLSALQWTPTVFSFLARHLR